MFFVTSAYSASPEAIARVLPAHRDWVADQYDCGIFALSGRLTPPTGGFMLAVNISRVELEKLLATDPFRIDGLLTHTIFELQPTRWAADLASLGAGA